MNRNLLIIRNHKLTKIITVSKSKIERLEVEPENSLGVGSIYCGEVVRLWEHYLFVRCLQKDIFLNVSDVPFIPFLGKKVVFQIEKENHLDKQPKATGFCKLEGHSVVVYMKNPGEEKHKLAPAHSELALKAEPFGVIVLKSEEDPKVLAKETCLLKKMLGNMLDTFKQNDCFKNGVLERSILRLRPEKVYSNSPVVCKTVQKLARGFRIKTRSSLVSTHKILGKFNLQEYLEEVFKLRVELQCGGSVVFQTTEALTSVDINSGKSTDRQKANEEALSLIARHLILKNITGLIVIDFITTSNRAQWVKQVKKVLIDVHNVTKVCFLSEGVTTMVIRRGEGTDLIKVLAKRCDECNGVGIVTESEEMQDFRLEIIASKVLVLAQQGNKKAIVEFSSNEIALRFLNAFPDVIGEANRKGVILEYKISNKNSIQVVEQTQN